MLFCNRNPSKPTQILAPELGCCYNEYPKILKCLWNWLTDRGWKSFKVHIRKSLDCLRETVHRNMDVKCDSGKSSERKEEICKENVYYLRDRHIIVNITLIEI